MRRRKAARKIPDWLLRMMAFGCLCWDRCYTHYMGLDRQQAQVAPALRIEVVAYTGKTVLLEDITRVKFGDQVIVLHLHNRIISKLDSGAAVSAFRASLRELALLVQREPRFSGVKACFADTILWAVIRRLGFETRSLPPIQEFLVRWGSRLLLVGFHEDGIAKADRYWELEARRTWISVPMLKNRFPAKLKTSP